jgi:hypothetical protein
MTIDVVGALSALALLRQHGFTVDWIAAEGVVRFEAPTMPRGDVSAALGLHKRAIAALVKPDASGNCGLDYHAVFQERLEERLAGGADNDNGCAAAFKRTIRLWLDREFERSARSASPMLCAHCARPEGDAVLLPIGWGDSHIWVHGACCDAWRAARRAEAIKALTRYGLANR